jgi:hypothetical protein
VTRVPCPGGAHNVEPAAQEVQPLADAEEAEPTLGPAQDAEVGGIEADPRIGHGARKPLGVLGERHLGRVHLGVLDDVQQEFPHRLIQVRGDRSREGWWRGGGEPHVHREPVLLPHPAGQPLQGGQQVALLQGGRVEFAGKRAGLGKGFLQEGNQLVGARVDRHGGRPRQHVRPKARRHQLLL